jgi:hypothetical protein
MRHYYLVNEVTIVCYSVIVYSLFEISFFKAFIRIPEKDLVIFEIQLKTLRYINVR